MSEKISNLQDLLKDAQPGTGQPPADNDKMTKAQLVRNLWLDQSRGGKQFSVRDLFDALTAEDARILVPPVISEVVLEAAQPLLTFSTQIFQQVHYEGARVILPALGALKAGDIAPTGEYPEAVQDVSATATVEIGKSGIICPLSEDLIKDSNFDIINFHLRAAGRALAAHKEAKCAALISSQGTTVYDNSTATRTGGRSAANVLNSTITIDDIFNMFATVVNYGYNPDTIVMHPLAWSILASEPTMQALALNTGAPYFQPMQGEAVPYRNPAMLGPYFPKIVQQTTRSEPRLMANPLRVLVSPFVPYNSTTNASTIIVCDSHNTGVIVQAEDVSTDQFIDPMRDVLRLKLRERYGMAVLNAGRAIALAKGVVHTKSYDWANRAVMSVGVSGYQG